MEEPSKKLDIDLEFLDKKDSSQTSKKEGIKQKPAEGSPKATEDISVRPWVRYWARYLDIIIFSIVFGIFLAIFMPSVLDSSNLFLTIVVLFVWIFAESALLSSWGTTPGKWLLRVELKDVNGNKPEFSTALNRSFAVWFRGLGFGIPIITLFTLIAAYNRLTKEGITSWDRNGHFTITHRKIGVIRTIVTIVIFIAFIFLLVLGES